jgi:ketosteroid isomerase-like protein
MNRTRAAISKSIVVVTTGMLVAMAILHPLLVAKSTSMFEIKKDGSPETKNEENMNQRVEQFFLEYERANASLDASAIGELYADNFMFGGLNGVQAVKKEDFLRIVPKMKAHLASMGLSETHLQTVEATPLDSKYLLARVAWRMTVRNSSGSKHVDAFATYVLERSQGDVLSIVFQIDHQDLATVIADR